jgi:hypothetical protein
MSNISLVDKFLFSCNFKEITSPGKKLSICSYRVTTYTHKLKKISFASGLGTTCVLYKTQK